MLGHDTTLPVELDEMVVATRSVARATTRALVVADLPFGTYEAGPEQALASAVRLMKAGANAVISPPPGLRKISSCGRCVR